ncbi:unnamed protein product [Ectocarpus sp. 12 AP-2014]
MPQHDTLKLLLALLLSASCLSAKAWARGPDLQGEPSDAHKDAHQWEGAVLRLDGRAAQEPGGTAQDHPFVDGEMNMTACDVESKSRRGYLNKLLEATALDSDNQVANVAFVKTHKTASTTVAAIMYRYAARHQLKLSYFGGSSSVTMLSSAARETIQSGQRVDLMHYHISARGQYKGTWNKAVTYYRKIMRNPDDINFVTVLREPRSHLLSYYYYYIQPQNEQSIEDFLLSAHGDKDSQVLFNTLSAEFGVQTAKEMDLFISSALPEFKLVLLAERLDEGLLTLGRMLHWHMIDLTYLDLNETKEGSRRGDGKTLVNRPHFDSLPKQVQNRIDDLTRLDRVLYEAGKIEFEKRLAPYATLVQEDIPQFQELKGVISDYLNGNSSSLACPMYLSMDIYKKQPDNYQF